MKLRVINPNTTASMTALIGAAARAVAAPGTLIDAVQPSFGAPSIEGHHDDVWAAAGVAEQVRAGRSWPAPTRTSSPASATPACTPRASWRAGR